MPLNCTDFTEHTARSIYVMAGTNNRVSVGEWEAFCLLLNFIKLTPQYIYQDSKALSFYSVKPFYKALYDTSFASVLFDFAFRERVVKQNKSHTKLCTMVHLMREIIEPVCCRKRQKKSQPRNGCGIFGFCLLSFPQNKRKI